MIRPRLELGGVGRAVDPRHFHDPHEVAPGCELRDPVRGLAALFRDYVDTQPRKAPRQMRDVGQDRPLERRVGVMPADRWHHDEEKLLAGDQAVVPPPLLRRPQYLAGPGRAPDADYRAEDWPGPQDGQGPAQHARVRLGK